MLQEGQKGFTLVEVVVALLLLSIVTVVVVQIYNSGFFAIAFGGKKTEAVYEVQALLERAILSPEAELGADAREDTLTISFQLESGEEKELSVKGYFITKESSEKFGANDRGVSATVFVPIGLEDD